MISASLTTSPKEWLKVPSPLVKDCKVSLDKRQAAPYIFSMIESFRHKGLQELFETGATVKIAVTFHKRIIVRLDALDAASDLKQLRQPGFDFHPLHGRPQRYSIHVNGPWTITFEWEDSAAKRVDFEQYH